MANTGAAWGSWAYVQKSSSNWSADALADNATETSDVLNVGTKAGIELGFTFYEDNTGAIDGDVTIYILRQAGTGPVYEQSDGTGSPEAFTVTPVQNDTVYKTHRIDPRLTGPFKIAVKNEAGQELAVTVEYRTSDIPVAS